MSVEGWYYLHTNGDLIYKGAAYTNVGDFRESDFVRAFWPVDPADRATAWRIAVEATAAGARPDRVAELVEKWGLTDEDAQVYAEHLGFRLVRDGGAWMATRLDFVDLMESPVGFGEHAYQAIAELAKALGYRPAKTWGPEFAKLVQAEAAPC